MQRPADGAQAVQGIGCTFAASRHPDQPDHLAFERIETHQVEGVFQHAAEAGVVVWGTQDDALSCGNLAAQLMDVLRIGVLVLVTVAENQVVAPQINQICADAEFLSALQCDLQAMRVYWCFSGCRRYPQRAGHYSGDWLSLKVLLLQRFWVG